MSFTLASGAGPLSIGANFAVSDGLTRCRLALANRLAQLSLTWDPMTREERDWSRSEHQRAQWSKEQW
jgi:hypothetical protein